MKSSNIISNRNKGTIPTINILNNIPLTFQWKVDLIHIKLNSDGGFPVGFNSTEVIKW